MIVLTDQFDASMVVLRRRFCWSYLDIFYRKYTVTHSERSTLSKEATAKLLSPKVNWGDKFFYDSLNKSWWNLRELKEDNFWDEVAFCLQKHF